MLLGATESDDEGNITMLICLDCPRKFFNWQQTEYIRHECLVVAVCIVCRYSVNPEHQHIHHYDAHGFLEPASWD